MKNLEIRELKKGYGINHPEYGYLQYRGLVTRHPFTDKPKEPHEYLFWQVVDENGKNQPDIVLSDGKLLVEVVDGFEENNLKNDYPA